MNAVSVIGINLITSSGMKKIAIGFVCLLLSVYAQAEGASKEICTVLSDSSKHRQIYFPQWHVVEGQTWYPPTLSESELVSINGDTFYLYKDFLSIRGQNIDAVLTASREKVPLFYAAKLQNLGIPIEEGINFNTKESDFRDIKGNIQRLESSAEYAELTNSQHRDVNLVQYHGAWYYLIFIRRNQVNIDIGNRFNAYWVSPDYSIDYVCTGKVK